MTLLLTLTHAPQAQLQTELPLGETDVVIGREIDCHWVIDDPECIVSGQHCVITSTSEGYCVTDTSTNGLMLNGGATALGRGNSALIGPGTTLGLGDYVISVIAQQIDGEAQGSKEKPAPMPTIDLGLRTSPSTPNPIPGLDDSPQSTPLPVKPPPSAGGLDAGGLFPGEPTHTPAAPPVANLPKGRHVIEPPNIQRRAPPDPQRRQGTPQKPSETVHEHDVAPSMPLSDDLYAAFLCGAGLDPADFPTDDAEAQMKALGQRYRSLVDGLIYMLRARDKQRDGLPVRKTQVGVRDNNPLKTLPGTDRPLAALIRPEGEGFLDPKTAIDQAFRDLALHNLSTWNGLEAALRKLIADMNPERFEQEADTKGWLQRAAAGGRDSTHWQLYKSKYKDLSEAAEQKFLGSVGTEFARVYDSDKRG
ncbi:MAG: type VI secretion system-associated FHA domain protein TagH [Paracoccaceae bacterium]|nr:type VI secretion system-associated FHA domain protein TagH [Paracoccaceae bacterium]